MNSSRILLGTAELNEAKRIRAHLAERGIQLELVSNPETCGTRGCKPTVEIYINEADRDAIQAFFREEKKRDLGGLELDPSLLEEVFDPEKETARCPACATTFSTTLEECPDCGLAFH